MLTEIKALYAAFVMGYYNTQQAQADGGVVILYSAGLMA